MDSIQSGTIQFHYSQNHGTETPPQMLCNILLTSKCRRIKWNPSLRVQLVIKADSVKILLLLYPCSVFISFSDLLGRVYADLLVVLL